LTKHFLNWTDKAERQQVTVPALPLFVHIAIPRRQFWKR
jgi:adenine-specific DNA-methyltransferase